MGQKMLSFTHFGDRFSFSRTTHIYRKDLLPIKTQKIFVLMKLS